MTAVLVRTAGLAMAVVTVLSQNPDPLALTGAGLLMAGAECLRPPRRALPRPEPEVWSLSYAKRLYAEDALTADQFEDVAGWVLDGGDLTLLSTRPPWPWRGR